MRWITGIHFSAVCRERMMRWKSWQKTQFAGRRTSRSFSSLVPGMLMIHSSAVSCADTSFVFTSVRSAVAVLPGATVADAGPCRS
jgi:hypothetical protein